jgi:rhodanese-related sulfurtransferase
MSVSTITPAELDALARRQPVELIDVRTPAEFREMHVGFARSVPLGSVEMQAMLAKCADRGLEPVYVICRSGSRAKQACEQLVRSSIGDTVLVEGGTLGWQQAGLPLVRGKKSISLERQVRIVAGSLVLLGSGLGALVHPAFAGLAAFVGAGLVFAGITDTCGMGLLLARMPWNQVDRTDPPRAEPASSCVGVSPGVES